MGTKAGCCCHTQVVTPPSLPARPMAAPLTVSYEQGPWWLIWLVDSPESPRLFHVFTCPFAEPQDSTCRQVITAEGVTMKSEPCYMLGASIGGRAPNALVAELARGDTITYSNTDSKQTSACGAASDPPGRTLCWVKATTSDGSKTGWVPVARGSFQNAFCDALGSVESLVASPCGEFSAGISIVASSLLLPCIRAQYR
jgi:hypothetical protein